MTARVFHARPVRVWIAGDFLGLFGAFFLALSTFDQDLTTRCVAAVLGVVTLPMGVGISLLGVDCSLQSPNPKSLFQMIFVRRAFQSLELNARNSRGDVFR